MSLKNELRKVGLKRTLPRLKILEIMINSEERHLSAEDIYRSLQDSGEEVGYATVYRVLAQFEEAGLVVRHHFEGERSVFELNDESHHDHMVCVECGRVFEFVDKTIESRQKKVAAAAGFYMEDHSLYLYGTCEGLKAEGKCSMK